VSNEPVNTLTDPNFYLGVAAVIVTVLVALAARRVRKLLLDVVCEAYLSEQKGAKNVASSQQGSNESYRALFVMDLRNPSWGILGWLGGLDIVPVQYERPISFSFGKRAWILEAGVVEEEPQGIGATLAVNHIPTDELVLNPVLLNQGDRLRLKVVVENPEVRSHSSWFGRKDSFLSAGSGFFDLRANGRIVGVKKIQRKRGFQELFSYGILAVFIALVPAIIVSVVGLIVWILTGDATLWLAAPIPFAQSPSVFTGVQTALLFLGQTLFLLAMRKNRRARRIGQRYKPSSSYALPVH